MPNIRDGGGYPLPDPHVPPGMTRVSMCIPDAPEVRQALVGALTSWAHWYNWEKSEPGSGDTRAVELTSEIYRSLVETLCFGGPMIRRNLANNCQLDVSYDCGETWETLIDVSDCVSSAVSPVVERAAVEILDKLDDLYDGTVSSIAPNLVYGDSDDDARDEALCVAWRVTIDTMVEAEFERRERERELWSGVAELMQDAAIAVIGLPIPGARWIAFGLALGSAALNGAIAAFTALDAVVLSDVAARLDVACCAYNSMAGSTPTEAGYTQALDNCTLTGNAELLRAAIQPVISDQGTALRQYLGLLAVWSDALPMAKQGLFDCPCDFSWTLSRLGGNGNANITIRTNGDLEEPMYYNASEDKVYWGWNGNGGTTNVGDTRIDLGGTATVTRLRYAHEDTGGFGSPDPFPNGYQLLLGGTVVREVLPDEVNPFHAYDWDIPSVSCDEVRVMGFFNDNEQRGRTAYIIVYGSGTAPQNAD